jgi:hypothetical protein
MTRLETMAKAICAAQATRTPSPMLAERMFAANPDFYVGLAKAALSAVREPTEAQVRAMNEAVLPHVCLEPPELTDARLWTAGIDAILEGRA